MKYGAESGGIGGVLLGLDFGPAFKTKILLFEAKVFILFPKYGIKFGTLKNHPM